jgi:hypothetical protein
MSYTDPLLAFLVSGRSERCTRSNCLLSDRPLLARTGRRALHSYAGCASLVFKTLCEQAGDADAYDENLTKAEASKRIDELKKELGLES